MDVPKYWSAVRESNPARYFTGDISSAATISCLTAENLSIVNCREVKNRTWNVIISDDLSSL